MEILKEIIRSLTPKNFHKTCLLKKTRVKINADSLLEHIIVLELYTLLTIIAFHKLFILGIDKYVVGDHGDAWQFI